MAAQKIGLANNVGMENVLAAPGQMQMKCEGAETEKLTTTLASTNSITIFQKMNLLEAITQGICEAKNQYKIQDENDQTILTAVESSSGCTRCCCAPYHSTMLYINDTDGRTLLSIERQGCQFPCPLKCIGAAGPTCCDCCKDGITVYNGRVEGDPGDLKDAPPPIFHLREAVCGGEKFFWPKLYVHKDLEQDPVGKITGPCIFGGCSELCMTATWNLESMAEGGPKLAEIVHMTPKTCEEVCQEVCTDTDRFKINYPKDAGQMDRTVALAGSLLVDYMFFEKDNGMLSCKGGKQIDITCCFCNCCGCQVPCKISLSKNGEEGGGGSGDTE